MKFSTTPILLTSLALSSTATFGAPLPPVPNSKFTSSPSLNGNTNNSKNLGLGNSRSPNPDDYQDSPKIGGNNNVSPLLGVGVGLNALSLGNINIDTKPNSKNSNTNSNPNSNPNNGLGLDVGLGNGLIGIGGMGRPNKRQLPQIPSPSNPTIPTNGVIPTSVPMIPQTAKSGLDVAGVTGLPQGQGLDSTVNGLGVNSLQPNQVISTASSGLNGLPLVGNIASSLPLQGLTGTLGGLTNGLPLQGLTGTVGGLTNGLPLQGLTGTVGGLTNGLPLQGLTNTVGGLTNGLPLQGVTGTLGGLTNGLPLQGLTGTLGGLTNGLPLQGLTNTVGGLTNGLPLQGTLNGLTGNLPLQGLTGTVGSLTNGLPLQGLTGTVQGLAANGPLSSVTQPINGIVGSLSANDPTAAVNSLSQGVTSTASNVAGQAPNTPALGNIVQSLGQNTYLLSSGQILRLASDISGMSGTGSTTAPALNGLRSIEVEGKMYIINPAGQLVGTLTLPATSTIGLYQDQNQDSDPLSFIDNNQSQSNSQYDLDDGWNSNNNPYPNLDNQGLLPLSSQPDATELVAQSMQGYEPNKSYLSSSSSTYTPENTSAYQDDTQNQGVLDVPPQPDQTWGQMTGSRMTTGIPTPIAEVTSSDSSMWGGMIPTATSTTISDLLQPTAAITAIPTASSISATGTPAEGWGEWVTGGVPTALPTAYWNNDIDDGAIGSAMVPQTSSGLA
ncbi:uncharacterized protein L201_006407 [Kwoniella dendrophila CBS 6074]|uniref:Uncharacterized protein n=1 Tax=Kwoniella dendrophila CBS 6074 TaxID=1295534 RepID=A0AAX4K1K5_9TREE